MPCHVELQNLLIQCHAPLFTNRARVPVSRNVEISPSKRVLPVRSGLCDAWGGRGQGFLASRRLCSIRLVCGRWSRPFLQPTRRFRAVTTSPHPSRSLPFSTDDLGAHRFAFPAALLRLLLPLNLIAGQMYMAV